MPTSHVPAIRRTKRTVPASRAHPIRTPHGRRLWWGQTHRNPKHSIPSIVDYAAAVADAQVFERVNLESAVGVSPADEGD